MGVEMGVKAERSLLSRSHADIVSSGFPQRRDLL